MKTFYLFFLVLFSLPLGAQEPGRNYDPDPQGRGQRPYEMAGRQETRPPALTFEDCTRWTVETRGCEAGLYRSDDQLLYRDHVGKLIYKATARISEIVVKPLRPVKMDSTWDCIDFWNYGAHWLWGEPDYHQALHQYALVRDGAGELHSLDFVQSGVKGMVYKYWFLNHIRLPEDLQRPLTFEGILFRGKDATGEKPLSVYLGPVYMYKEELDPLHFAEYPEELPFPVHETTILPLNKQKDYLNRAEPHGESTDFLYKGEDATIRYRVMPGEGLPLGVVLVKGKETVSLFRGGGLVLAEVDTPAWKITHSGLRNDTLRIEAVETHSGTPFRFFYTIRRKSLIIGMQELSREGHVEKVELGTTGPVKKGRLIDVPFLNFDYAVAPRILYDDGLFYFMQFDWYYTDASEFFMNMPDIEGKWATHNGGARYIPMTNGVRNPLHEKLFVTVSPDVQEVFPTVDNPPSPMRSLQACRLWRIVGSADYPALRAEADRLRSLGLEQVTIRYHEGFWRDGGESYTFRLETAPGRGGNTAVKKTVRYIQSKGWRVGLYTNYTDLAPVNRNWNADMMMQGPHGEWKVSWSRCYAPKPMRALEYERIYAPLIHKMFGTTHSYCDVHTAVSPMSRVDYDYRVPGAATFRRTFECFGQILYNEKTAYSGPVYSEGANHWWYAGLVDGNYANARPALDKRDLFPDFQLLKLHPLEMDAGNVQAAGRKYLAYTLAYGHIGILNGDDTELMRRYYMLQPLQEHYSMVPVREISYEKDGKYYDASAALVMGLNKEARLRVIYASGFRVYVNFSGDPWQVSYEGRTVVLPRYGFLAVTADGATRALAGRDLSWNLPDTASVDMMISPEMIYLDTRGNTFSSPQLAGKGRIAMKKETFGWEIIPARSFDTFGFDPTLTGLKDTGLHIISLTREGVPVGPVLTHRSGHMLRIDKETDGAWKYRIVPGN